MIKIKNQTQNKHLVSFLKNKELIAVHSVVNLSDSPTKMLIVKKLEVIDIFSSTPEYTLEPEQRLVINNTNFQTNLCGKIFKVEIKNSPIGRITTLKECEVDGKLKEDCDAFFETIYPFELSINDLVLKGKNNVDQ